MDYLGPFYLHYNAFLGTIEMLGDETQVAHWRKLVFAGLVAGAYGQTELGHGSDVKSL
jgi:acyl-CoA oxidase